MAGNSQTLRQILIVTGLACGIILAGCLGPLVEENKSTGDDVTENAEQDDGGIRQGSGTVSFSDRSTFEDYDEIQSPTERRLSANLRLNVVDSVNFDRVMFCSYDKAGSLLTAETVGNFDSTHDVTNFTATFNQTPYYMFVYHPQFKEYNVSIGSLYKVESSTSAVYKRKYQSFLDIQRELERDSTLPEEAGECP